MSAARDIATIARWEVKKSFSVMSRNVLPVAIVLFVLLVIVTGFAAQSGLHIQDGMYRLGVDDPQVAALFASDARFTVYQASDAALAGNRGEYDLVIVKGVAYANPTEKGQSALTTLERDYLQVQKWRLQERERSLCRIPALDRYPDGTKRTQLYRHPERPVRAGSPREEHAGPAGHRPEYPHTLTHAWGHAG